MTMTNVIYGLIDPNTGELRYIGKTYNIRRRFGAHYTPSNLRAPTHKNNWLRRLLTTNQKPEVWIIETHPEYADLYDAEIELIAYYRSIGARLTNATPGGDGLWPGYQASPETRAKISAAGRGRIQSGETRRKIAQSLTGSRRSLETRRKMSEDRRRANAIKRKTP